MVDFMAVCAIVEAILTSGYVRVLVAQFQFNIMDAVGYGYYRVWQERTYLGKLAFFPFLIKLACVIGVYVLGLESNILRQGLILFPAYLAEGWMLAQFLRTLLKDERWPVFVPEQAGQDFLTKLMPRARGIIAATLVYTLLELFTNILRYVTFGNLTPEDMTRMSEDAAKQKAEGCCCYRNCRFFDVCAECSLLLVRSGCFVLCGFIFLMPC